MQPHFSEVGGGALDAATPNGDYSSTVAGLQAQHVSAGFWKVTLPRAYPKGTYRMLLGDGANSNGSGGTSFTAIDYGDDVVDNAVKYISSWVWSVVAGVLTQVATDVDISFAVQAIPVIR